MNWYEIIKDIVIPLLGVCSTIVIGIVIAIVLKRKEEKAKIKSLLIDSYMQFLNVKQKFFEHQVQTFYYQILKDLDRNYDSYFARHANSHITKERIKKKLDTIDAKLEAYDPEDANWTPFTYRFAFLLGAKKYAEEVQILEDNILNSYFKEGATDEFSEKLKIKIKNHEKIKEAMSTSNQNKIDDAIEILYETVAKDYSEFQYRVFNPYANKVADLIDQY